MSAPSKIGDWREAKEARELCGQMGALCTGHSHGVVAAALSGLISQLDPFLQLQLMQSIQERSVHLELPDETTTAIDEIVKGTPA